MKEEFPAGENHPAAEAPVPEGHSVAEVERRAAFSTKMVQALLRAESMFVLDLIVLLVGLGTVLYVFLRLIGVAGQAPFAQDCSLAFNLLDGMADIFVFYGVILESRHLLLGSPAWKSRLEDLHGHVLNETAEISGILLVALGLMLEVVTHVAQIVVEISVPDWLLVSLSVISVGIVWVALHQTMLHLWSLWLIIRSR